MKKIWTRLTAVLACLTLIGAGASIRSFAADKDPETGETIYSTQPALHYITENGAHTITDYYGGNTRKIIVIPNDVAGNPFSKIRSGAFEGIQADTVFVPDTMMEIEPGAFDPGTQIKVYAAGDYRGFTQPTSYQRDENGRRYLPDPDTSMLTVKSDTQYYSTVTVNGVAYRLEGISATVTGYSGTETELKIAPSVNGLPVTTVESGALKDAALTKLYLPKSVTRVEEGALGEYEVVFRADTGSGVSTNEDPSIPEYIPSSEEEVSSSEENQSTEEGQGESQSSGSGSGNESQTGSTEHSGNATSSGSEETDATAEVGTFDMDTGDFVTTEAEESGSEEETEVGSETEDESGTEPEEKTAEEPDESKPAGDFGEEMTREGQTPSPWLFIGIGGAVIIAGAAVALALYFKKRSGK